VDCRIGATPFSVKHDRGKTSAAAHILISPRSGLHLVGLEVTATDRLPGASLNDYDCFCLPRVTNIHLSLSHTHTHTHSHSTMGFLERARSTRGRHQKQRSMQVDEVTPQGTSTTTPATPASARLSTTKPKRKSLFPGIGTTTTSCEATRPRSRSSAHPGFYSEADSTSRNGERSYPSNMQFVTGNDSFRFPSPALVNNSTKKSPLTSVAHLPPLTTGNNSAIFTSGPQETSRKQPPSWNRSHTDPMMSATQREVLPMQANTWDDKLQRPQLKKQKSAWKTFGSFFKGSKQARQSIPDQFYQIQPPSNDDLAQSGNATRGKMGVLDSPIPSPISKDEPTVARVDSGHGAEKGAGSLMPPPNRDAFPVRTSSRVSANFFEPMSDSAGDSSSGNPRRTPRLDINIPDAGFDRYSVMFEKLLEPKVPLIERRKSKRFKDSGSPVEGPEHLGAKKPSGLQRSLTSPSLNRAPSLTIHIANSNRANRASTVPNPSKAPAVSHRPQAPKRSMTTPVNNSTPISVPSESRTPNTAIAAPLPASTTTASSPRCSIMSENSLPPTPNTANSLASSINTTVFGPSSSSPPKEPKQNQASSSQQHQQDDAPPVPPLPNRSNDRPALLRNPPSGTERFNRQIVQVSVARQVSVSKARKRVADAVEVKQPLRPRVVELGKNRKSTLVLIEGGD